MKNIAQRYNRTLITLMATSPIGGFVLLKAANVDFFTTMQILSYLGAILLLLFKKRSQPLRLPRYLLFYLFFTLYVYYSAFFQLDREFKMRYLFANRFLGGFVFLFIIENLIISRKYYEFIVKISAKILIAAVIVIVIQEVYSPIFMVNSNYARFEFLTELDKTKSRLFSIYSWIGGFNAIGFGFVPILIIVAEEAQRRGKKIYTWILLGLLFALLSKARWIMLNTLLIFVLLIINKKNKGQQVLKYVFLVPFFALVAFVALDKAGINVNGILVERILESDKKDMNQRSAGTRLLAFTAFDKFFWEDPWFGKGNIKYGMGGTGEQDYKLKKFLGGRSAQIHVGYLNLLYMYGFIGGFFFLASFYLLLKKLYKGAKTTRVWAPFLGLLGLALGNLTLVTFTYYEMGFIIAMVAHRYYNQNQTINKKLHA